MNILHSVKKENSGLFRSTLELATYEQKQGHTVCLKQPHEDMPIYGVENGTDVHSVHSQLNQKFYHDNRPKFLWCHGEPLSSVGNGISMKAVVDLAPMMDAFICMRKDEWVIWNAIRRTYIVPKGIDLEVFKPLPNITEKLSGEPAVLYYENWRGQRNPLYVALAMQIVHQKYPKARLHLYNCQNQQLLDTFNALIKQCKWWTFIRSLQGPVKNQEVNLLLNRADIVVSCLSPLFARGVEAFGAGKAFIGPGYREHHYPFQCDLQPESIADAVVSCWENYNQVKYREWAEQHHDVADTVKQSVEIYSKWL